MPLINHRVKENAKKCEQCAIMRMRNNIDNKGVLHEEAQYTAEGVIRLSCTLCPFAEDFQKMHGKKPYEYYPGLEKA